MGKSKMDRAMRQVRARDKRKVLSTGARLLIEHTPHPATPKPMGRFMPNHKIESIRLQKGRDRECD